MALVSASNPSDPGRFFDSDSEPAAIFVHLFRTCPIINSQLSEKMPGLQCPVRSLPLIPMTLMFPWKSPSQKKDGWTFGHGPLRRITSLLMTGESNSPNCSRLRVSWVLIMGFDKGMAAMRQQMFCVPRLTFLKTALKTAQATPPLTLEVGYFSHRSFLN